MLGSSFKSYTWYLKNNRKDPLALKVSEKLSAAPPLASPSNLPRHPPKLQSAQQNSHLEALSKMRCLQVCTNRVALIPAPCAGSRSALSPSVWSGRDQQGPCAACASCPSQTDFRGVPACGQVTAGVTRNSLQPVASQPGTWVVSSENAAW